MLKCVAIGSPRQFLRKSKRGMVLQDRIELFRYSLSLLKDQGFFGPLTLCISARITCEARWGTVHLAPLDQKVRRFLIGYAPHPPAMLRVASERSNRERCRNMYRIVGHAGRSLRLCSPIRIFRIRRVLSQCRGIFCLQQQFDVGVNVPIR